MTKGPVANLFSLVGGGGGGLTGRSGNEFCSRSRQDAILSWNPMPVLEEDWLPVAGRHGCNG